MSPIEKKHIQAAAQFELGKVEDEEIQQKMINHFNKVRSSLLLYPTSSSSHIPALFRTSQVDHGLAQAVAEELALECPAALNNNDGRTSSFLSMVTGSRQGQSPSCAFLVPPLGTDIVFLLFIFSLLCRYPKDRNLRCRGFRRQGFPGHQGRRLCRWSASFRHRLEAEGQGFRWSAPQGRVYFRGESDVSSRVPCSVD